jgi:hypothetical protein
MELLTDNCDMTLTHIALLPIRAVLGSSGGRAWCVAFPDRIGGCSANQVHFLLSLGNLNEHSCVPKLPTPNPGAHQLKKLSTPSQL